MTAIYREMNRDQVIQAYDVYGGSPGWQKWLQQNAEHAQTLQARLNPVKDVPYGKEPLQTLDIYAPKDVENAPVLIDIHGGGWHTGSKSPRAVPAETVCAHGAIFVSIDYGLAPEYSLEQIIDHVGEAVAWVYHNIAKHGGDPNKLFVYGNSAGGHLAATTLMPGWHDRYRVPEKAICGVIPVSGVFDLASQIYSEGEVQKVLQLSLEEAQLNSPLHHKVEVKTPVIIAYGENEPVGYAIESQDYAKVLREAGCEVKVIEVPGVHHFEVMNELCNEKGDFHQAVFELMGLK